LSGSVAGKCNSCQSHNPSHGVNKEYKKNPLGAKAATTTLGKFGT